MGSREIHFISLNTVCPKEVIWSVNRRPVAGLSQSLGETSPKFWYLSRIGDVSMLDTKKL